MSVRAAMLVRLRALDVVLGRSPRPESSKDRNKEAKRAKATRLAAVHVASESGIPADRGNFKTIILASRGTLALAREGLGPIF